MRFELKDAASAFEGQYKPLCPKELACPVEKGELILLAIDQSFVVQALAEMNRLIKCKHHRNFALSYRCSPQCSSHCSSHCSREALARFTTGSFIDSSGDLWCSICVREGSPKYVTKANNKTRNGHWKEPCKLCSAMTTCKFYQDSTAAWLTCNVDVIDLQWQKLVKRLPPEPDLSPTSQALASTNSLDAVPIVNDTTVNFPRGTEAAPPPPTRPAPPTPGPPPGIPVAGDASSRAISSGQSSGARPGSVEGVPADELSRRMSIVAMQAFQMSINEILDKINDVQSEQKKQNHTQN